MLFSFLWISHHSVTIVQNSSHFPTLLSAFPTPEYLSIVRNSHYSTKYRFVVTDDALHFLADGVIVEKEMFNSEQSIKLDKFHQLGASIEFVVQRFNAQSDFSFDFLLGVPRRGIINRDIGSPLSV